MKSILLGIIILLLGVSTGYCKERSLQLTIESNKQAYQVGESISINSRLDNISNKPFKLAKLLKSTGIKIYFKNEYEQKYVLKYAGVSGNAMPSELPVGGSIYFTGVTFSLPNKATEFEKYKVLGKQSIYMVDRGLTSNTITISLGKEEKIAN